MSVLQKERSKLFIHLNWPISSKSLVTTLISVLLVVLYLFTVLSLPTKLIKYCLAVVKKKLTSWLVGTLKCGNLGEFQFHFQIFRNWVIKYVYPKWMSFRQLVHKIFRNFGSFFDSITQISEDSLEKSSE